ncbi:hypothetical protein J4Q44_G00018930 [Coregonus suidteri]|uniref:Ig-like domain-containing protein n=1 Tax=Coregonus suidteri TaxID=861788 RepID=A0AAN8M8R4_9TELE
MGCRVFLAVILGVVCLLSHCQKRRLSEFAQQWTLDPGLPHEVYVSLGTCKYNIPRCIVGEKSPPEAIESPTTQIYSQREVELGVPNTILCRVSDFHPIPVDVTWTRNEQPEGDIYSFSVGHVSLQDPLTRIWEVEVHTDHQTVETAVCVGGVTLGVVGVATGVWFIKKAKSTLERIVPPTVKVRLTKPSRYGELSMLECSVLGFYPQVTHWLTGTGASSSTPTWSSGPREVVWDTSGLDAKRFKMALGVCSLFIGVAMAIRGGVYYWWKNRSGFRHVNR